MESFTNCLKKLIGKLVDNGKECLQKFVQDLKKTVSLHPIFLATDILVIVVTGVYILVSMRLSSTIKYTTNTYNTEVTTEDIANVVTKDIINKTVSELTSSDKKEVISISKEVYTKIEDVRQGKTTPIASTASSADSKEVKKVVDSTKPTTVITEPTTKTTGTNVYSISVKRSQHGLGIYMGYTNKDTSIKKNNMSYGVHYRNRRTIYQIGVDGQGKLDGRIAYEVAQW